MNLTCCVIDDEQHAIEVLADHIVRTPGLLLKSTFSDPVIALNGIYTDPPLLTFADIDMPGLSGLELASLAGSRTAIVFTTSFPEYALNAFEKHAIDYLLKPISYERFLRCLQKVRPFLAATSTDAHQTLSSIFVQTGVKGKYERIPVHTISHVNGLSNYIEINLASGRIVTYLKLDEILEKLPAERFSRIHKSHIVHHDFIRSVGQGMVLLNNGILLPVGRAYYQAFRQKLDHEFLISRRDKS